MKYHVPDMSCGHCTAAIENTIRSLDPDAHVETDLASRTVDISSSRDPQAVETVLKDAGYPATPV